MSSDEKPRNATYIVTEPPKSIMEEIEKLRALFAAKNAEYKNESCWYNNFMSSGPVIALIQSPITYCMTLAAKQDAAVWEHLRRGDTTTDTFRERLRDGAVYRIIALALLHEDLSVIER